MEQAADSHAFYEVEVYDCRRTARRRYYNETGVPNMAQTATATEIGLERAAVRSGFFFWISVLLLAFLVIGFAPSLYLRAFFEVPPIPAYLHVHGAILTSWFAWLVLQTSMVRTGRTATHRRLGVIGAVIAVAVVFAGPMATVGAVGRLREAGFDWDTDMSALPAVGVEGVPMIRFAAQVVWGNFLSIVVFAGLVATAIVLRRHPDSHKRLMLLASIAIVGPALARISRWPVFGGEDSPFIPSVLLTLLVAVIVHDVVTTRRVHKATLYGAGALVIGTIAQQLIAGSELGRSVVRMLG